MLCFSEPADVERLRVVAMRWKTGDDNGERRVRDVLGYCLWALIMAAGPLLYVSYYLTGPSGTILSSVVLVLLWTLMYFWHRLLL